MLFDFVSSVIFGLTLSFSRRTSPHRNPFSHFPACTRPPCPAGLPTSRRTGGAVWRAPHRTGGKVARKVAGMWLRSSAAAGTLWAFILPSPTSSSYFPYQFVRPLSSLSPSLANSCLLYQTEVFTVSHLPAFAPVPSLVHNSPITIFATDDEPPTCAGVDDDDIGLESSLIRKGWRRRSGWMIATCRAPRMCLPRMPRTVSQPRRTASMFSYTPQHHNFNPPPTPLRCAVALRAARTCAGSFWDVPHASECTGAGIPTDNGR